MHKKAVLHVPTWELLAILVILGASATIFMIALGYNRCIALQAACGRERLAYCADWIDTGVQPLKGTWTEDLWSTDIETCIKNCVMEGTKPEEFCCPAPSRAECKEALD